MIYELNALSFAYPGGRRVLDQVSLTLKRGEVLSIL